MSLLLCRQERVNRPYFMEALGVHLYSSQELSYVIYNHPLLVMDGFVDGLLLKFLREELNQGVLVAKLERILKNKDNTDDALTIILQECDYYNSAEVSRFRKMVAMLRKKNPLDFKRMKADELFSLRQYGRAVELYKEILDCPGNVRVDPKFIGTVRNNLGSCYARMFRLDKALEAFEAAYEATGQIQVLKRMYNLSQLDERLVLSDKLKGKITEEMKREWDNNLEKAKEKAAQSEAVQKLEELFRKDPVKRQAGEAALLRQWKQEYRHMAVD
ncbi:MAG: hypothetical protein HFG60_12900 [Lachnospiraceae bacterium]|nr:hypothetical protein [Lachnospiraceae bacterium]